MRIALLSDIHSNIDALQSCLREAERSGVDRFAFLGDLVGYGAEPGAVIDVIAGYAARGAIVVKGNHDLAMEKRTNGVDETAQQVLEWTRAVLSSEQRNFLASLPFIVREDETCFVHSSARAPESWEYVETAAAARENIDAATTTYTFAGHVHDQVLYFRTLAGKTAPFRPTSGSPVPVPSHRGWLAIVGSVGQARDGNPAAAWALFDGAREEITFYRVPYDHVRAAERIRRAGLPEWAAHRVEHGI